MDQQANLRTAIREATTVLRRFPLPFTLPLIGTGLCGWAIGPWSTRVFSQGPLAVSITSSLAVLVVVMASSVVTAWTGVLLPAMYRRADEGGEPSLRQVAEVAHYRGVFPVMFELLAKTIGWTLLFLPVFLVVSMIPVLVRMISTAGTNGIGAVAGGFSEGSFAFHALPLAVFAVWLLSRYLFVLPMLGIGRGAHPNLVAECVALSKRMRWTAALVTTAELAPTGIAAIVQHIPTLHSSTIPHAAATATSLLGTLAGDCLSAWLVMVTTSLLTQGMNEAPLAVDYGYPTQGLPQPEA